MSVTFGVLHSIGISGVIGKSLMRVDARADCHHSVGPGATAAFDFDGTLTRRDTLLPFLGRLCGPGAVGWALTRETPLLVRVVLGRASRDEAKGALLESLLRGRRMDDLRKAAGPYAEHVLARRMRDGMLARVNWHRAQGHELVVVSASLEVYVAPVARRLGFDATLATRLEVDDRGVLTGRLEGKNVRGPEKARRVSEHLAGRPLGWAYGDSAGDRELLAAAEVAHLRGRRMSGWADRLRSAIRPLSASR